MVYVDKSFQMASSDPQAFKVGKKHGHIWCHMWADSVEELIDFALSLGMKREWLQKSEKFPHFDLVPTRRARAIAKGAVEMSIKEWLRKTR